MLEWSHSRFDDGNVGASCVCVSHCRQELEPKVHKNEVAQESWLSQILFLLLYGFHAEIKEEPVDDEESDCVIIAETTKEYREKAKKRNYDEFKETHKDSCCLCLDAEPTNIVAECGHKCLCNSCAEGFYGAKSNEYGTRYDAKCPICRTYSLKHIRVY